MALLALPIGLAIGCFTLDLWLPLGVAIGVLYLPSVLLAAWSPWRQSIAAIAAISTAFIAAGYFLSSPGIVAWVALLNRSLGIFAIGVTAIILIQRKKAEQQLQEARDELESRVDERTEALRASYAALETQIGGRQQAEVAVLERDARLQGIMENVVDGIITIDEAGNIESLNHAAEDMFGYSADRVLGQNVSLLMPEPWRSQHDGYVERYLQTGRGKIIDIGPREVLGLNSDGETFPLELAVSVMEIGDTKCFIGVMRDISLRKESDARLQQALKMEAVGQLTGGVAHDFNNLLTVILGNLEILRGRAEGNPDIEGGLEMALKATFRAADLTQRLLAFSRKQALSPEPSNSNQLVSGLTEMLRRTLGEEIEIETVLAGGLWDAVIDPGQLENALLNLAINARDAMPDGGKLTIETANSHLDQAYADAHEEVTPGQYVMIAVTDTGTGMSAEVIERAYEPFFTTKEVGEGSGLGLSMIYGFVKQSDGHIKIYSELGEGTTFKLYLPRASRGVGVRRKVGLADSAHPRGDETILVVEDDPDVRTFLVSTLEILGYRVYHAEDGPKALALLEEAPDIDMLLTDVVLPQGMNGRQVADEVQKILPDIKVLFTSGYTENAIVHHGRLDEDAELLAKPYTIQTLSKTVRAILDR